MNYASRDAPADEEILERARSGEDRAFAILVERYEGIVAATAIGMLGPGDDAEDVGQETFIRFHRSMDRFRGESSIATYLTRIAINLSLTALKRRRKWSERFKGSERRLEYAIDGQNPAHDLERDERVARVRAAIEALSLPHRTVVVLRLIDGYSTRETAEILQVPQGTVMSRLARAMDQLESLLKEMDT
ncbi:MAG: sigma-70 family RNA polymerase sigma factor [Gemmatimonadota bacterium]|nr:sigma-70 family RNA polymerase sigma factor [Gemmatimonadota bacterium]